MIKANNRTRGATQNFLLVPLPPCGKYHPCGSCILGIQCVFHGMALSPHACSCLPLIGSAEAQDQKASHQPTPKHCCISPWPLFAPRNESQCEWASHGSSVLARWPLQWVVQLYPCCLAKLSQFWASPTIWATSDKAACHHCLVYREGGSQGK